MIYVYIIIPLIFIGLFLWNTIRGNKKLRRVKEYSNKPNISKVALWIDLNSINGHKPNFNYSYWKKVKSEASDSSQDIIVLLIEAGIYDFVVSSKSFDNFKNVSIKANIKAGTSYQLGCNEDGVYLREESDSSRYKL